VTIHIGFADLFAALAWVAGGVAFVWLFTKWMLRAARGAAWGAKAEAATSASDGISAWLARRLAAGRLVLVVVTCAAWSAMRKPTR
jgi:hypothetical protein